MFDTRSIQIQAGNSMIDDLLKKGRVRKLTNREMKTLVYLGASLGADSTIVQSEKERYALERKDWKEDPSTWLD